MRSIKVNHSWVLKDAYRFFYSSLIDYLSNSPQHLFQSRISLFKLNSLLPDFHLFDLGYRVIHGELSYFLYIISHSFLLPFCLRKTMFYLVSKPTPSIFLNQHLFTYFVIFLIIHSPFLSSLFLKNFAFWHLLLSLCTCSNLMILMKYSFPLRLYSFSFP